MRGRGRGDRRPGQQRVGRQDEEERESTNAERGVDDEQEARAMVNEHRGSGFAGVQDLAAWCPSPSLYTTVGHPNLLLLAFFPIACPYMAGRGTLTVTAPSSRWPTRAASSTPPTRISTTIHDRLLLVLGLSWLEKTANAYDSVRLIQVALLIRSVVWSGW